MSARRVERGAPEAGLEQGIRCTVARARASGRPQFLAWVAPLPELEAESGIRCLAWAGPRDRCYWERIDAGELHFAWGSLDELEGEGPERYAAVRAWQRDVGARLDWLGLERPPTRPLFVGGFAFDEGGSTDPDWKAFPAARFVLPEGIIERASGEARCVLLARIEAHGDEAALAAELVRRLDEIRRVVRGRGEPGASGLGLGDSASAGSMAGVFAGAGTEVDAEGPEYRVRADRSHARFRVQVRQALAEIASGRFAKLVLARSLAVEHDADFDVPGFLARLRGVYPSCTLIAIGRGRDSFVAATPETLVRVEGDRLETAALAGSAPRGRTPDEDLALGRGLLASAKNRAEHAHVVEAIRAVLRPRTASLAIPAEPRLKALFGIQHLETPIEARLAATRADEEATDVLALVAALHPTPAVAGAPAREAAAWLRRFEGLERGWYAAPIGWLDAQGGGAFCVALRSALIRNGVGAAGRPAGSRARLFAGAGLVEGSDPEQELVETRIKLRALLAPLTEI
ncbi:MAG: isochorismate synthase [Deltaproteobacteria bacterium]|nr:isochorismate synthase [Deltaproteobacteria bacterium]